jgi:hypothetical protein
MAFHLKGRTANTGMVEWQFHDEGPSGPSVKNIYIYIMK